MKNKKKLETSHKEFLGVIIFSCLSTLVMIYLEAFERLYIFIRSFAPFQLGEISVFFPSFLAIGFTCFSYRRIKELESEVFKRKALERTLRESEKKFKGLSITDDLTRLYNSRYFYHRMGMEVARAVRYKHPLSVLLLDIDNFKNFNDNYGHLAGDDVLKKLGKTMNLSIRKTDSAYRYGGEEFAVILPETSGSDAVVVSERIRKAFENEIFTPLPNHHVRTTVSIGVGEYENTEKIEGFLKRVDTALYVAKEKGKNRVSVSKNDHARQVVSPLLNLKTT
jgi:diguanylate cyclase (GGDEF)-like protein